MTYDLLIVGGGINGVGIAVDAASRGLSICLCEKGDLASSTSSASSKLIHGGLRYLEQYEFKLVRKALAERETLLTAAPHIVWPLRFRLPHMPSLRPKWMIRIGLWLYDNLARRGRLGASKSLKFTSEDPLTEGINHGFEYADCWVDDARLVVLNAQRAKALGARILPRTRCDKARREGDQWQAQLTDTQSGTVETVSARVLVNAAGPWVQSFIEGALDERPAHQVRLVRGSHIVVPKLYNGDEAYILQLEDGRIMFAIPYEDDYTLVGTTDHDAESADEPAVIARTETDYLVDATNRYFKSHISTDDIVWSYSGLRPLLEDESTSASSVTRDYKLTFDGRPETAGLLSVFGGKITTYRPLAEEAVDKLRAKWPNLAGGDTRSARLPGGDFDSQHALDAAFAAEYPWLDASTRTRFVRSYGTLARTLIGDAASMADMGEDFGGGLTARETDYLMDHEWAQTSDDIIWRRTKRGLKMRAADVARLDIYIAKRRAQARPQVTE